MAKLSPAVTTSAILHAPSPGLSEKHESERSAARCCSGEQLDCGIFGEAQLAFKRKSSPGASGRSQPARP